MSKIEYLAVKDHEGIERPAYLIERSSMGTVVDWHRTGRQEIVFDGRCRTVSADVEWDYACEWDQFRPISRTCVKCGQTTLTSADPLCEPCKALAREPQGETVRLFTPAPNQLDGQLTF